MVATSNIIGNTGVTTQEDIPQLLSASYSKILLKVNYAKLPHASFGERINIGKGENSTTITTRVEKMSEGTISPENSNSYTEPDKVVETPYSITGTSFEKMAILNFTILELHENQEILSQTVDRMRTSFEETMDKVAREALRGAPSYIASSGTIVGTVTEPVEADFLRIETFFESADVERITGMIPPTQNVSTESVDSAYITICHTDLTATLRQVATFIDKKNYGSQVGVLQGEIGTIGAFRLIITSKGVKNDDGTYVMFMIGKNAYHTLKVGNDIFGVGKDPRVLNKYSEVGYRFRFGGRITNPNNILQVITKPKI